MHGKSWILELRERLETPPPLPLTAERDRYAALVPLYVEAGQIWVLLSRSESLQGGAVFASIDLAEGEEAWAGARRAAAAMDLDAANMLPLGELDHVPTATGEALVPCVAVVPPPDEEAGARRHLAPLPLVAAQTPSLIEERSLQVGGEDVWIRVVHIGPIKLAGAGVEILENLLERVYHG